MAEGKKPISKKQQAHVAKYNAAHYDRVSLMLYAGDRDLYAEHAKSHGYASLNKFIIEAMKNQRERDIESK